MKNNLFILTVIVAVLGATFSSAQTKQTDSSQPPPIEVPATAETNLLTVDVKICSNIENRQPVGVGDRFDASVEKLFLWSKISGATDSISITHIWLYEGKEMAVVNLPVKSASWRAWSSKKILPSWTGEWEARVVGPDGLTMATTRFMIVSDIPGGGKKTE